MASDAPLPSSSQGATPLQAGQPSAEDRKLKRKASDYFDDGVKGPGDSRQKALKMTSTYHSTGCTPQFAKQFGEAVVATIWKKDDEVPISSLAELTQQLLASNKFTPEEKKFLNVWVNCEEGAEDIKVGVAYKMANIEIGNATKKEKALILSTLDV